MAGQWAVAAAWCLALLVLARLLIGLVAYLANRRKRNVKTMVVLGSGEQLFPHRLPLPGPF